MLDAIHHAYGDKEGELPSRPGKNPGGWETAAPCRDAARPRLAKGVRLQTDSATGNGVLLFPEGIVELNETAHEILTRCDGRTLGEIVQALAGEYDADPAALATDVRETVANLQQRKLIELV
jgi:pyrroloquinoline quinone biosynthesis protein D